MNIYLSASLFALLILFYWVISEVFTMLFRLIGLPEEKARFQVTSLLTGAGFTTRESEMILTTKRRRRLARIDAVRIRIQHNGSIRIYQRFSVP